MANVMAAGKLAHLLRSADPQSAMHVQILGDRLVFGVNPSQPSHMIDFSGERVVPYKASASPPALGSSDNAIRNDGARITRRSGEYWFEIRGKRTECGSLKELLAEALKGLERAKPGTLEQLSRIRGRSRRIVSHDANRLFDKPHLVKDHAEKLGNGWYYGTNNSARETGVWIQRAVECAGLVPGTDFMMSLSNGPSLEDL
jgi:hypothetical protein